MHLRRGILRIIERYQIMYCLHASRVEASKATRYDQPAAKHIWRLSYNRVPPTRLLAFARLNRFLYDLSPSLPFLKGIRTLIFALSSRTICSFFLVVGSTNQPLQLILRCALSSCVTYPG